MSEKHYLVEVSTYNEFMSGAAFAIVPPEVFDTAKLYYAELKRMNEAGMSVSRLVESNCATYWLEELPCITKELAEQIIVISDNFDNIDCLLEEAIEDCRPTVTTIEELCEWEMLVKDENLCTECDTLNVMKDDFTIKAHIKNTEVQMETNRLDCKYSLPYRSLSESEFYTEEEKATV